VIAEICGSESIDPGDVLRGNVAERRPQLTNSVAGECVIDPRAVTPSSYETRLSE